MLEKQLEILEDTTFHGLARNTHLEAIQNALDNGDSLSVKIIERILAICVRDLKEEVRHAVFCINIITKTLRRYQAELPISKLLPSAEAVLNLLLTIASLNRADSLQTLTYQALLTYPDVILAEAAFNCNDVYELFNLYCNMKTPLEIRFQPVCLALKVMNALTSDKKTTFVRKGLAVWFSKVIPWAMCYFQTQSIATTPMVVTLLELLEILTEELVAIDYAGNSQWLSILDNIYNPNLYPAQMKNLLMNGSVFWHRIWIVFIKLLKTQITVNKPGVGSPINSMLPVVEMAFKMDVKNRCKAFQCWNVLIDNFSAETNELFVNKRIKLLIIPLRSNNAKVEETALAKFETWWHLIKKYERIVDDKMLYPFLHFCFGRHVPEKTLIPGMISANVKKNCVEAFVEMVGHVNCDGCGSQVKLKQKLISTKVLVDHWSDWLHSLKMTIKISAEDDVTIEKQQITCAWKSFVMTIAELPENNLRKDLFTDLLTIVKEMAEGSTSRSKLADIVNNVLISSLLEEPAIKELFKTEEYLNGPMHMLISILTDSRFTKACKIHNIDNMQTSLKQITEFVVKDCPSLEKKVVEWLIVDGSPDDNTLMLWTALANALQVSKSRHDSLHRMCNLLLWPLKNLQHFTDVEAAALTWNSIYSVLHLMTVQTAWFHAEVNRNLLSNENSGPAAAFFVLSALLAVIKTKINTKTYVGLNNEVKLLRVVTCKYNDYYKIKPVFPILIDTVDLLSTTAPTQRLLTENVDDIFLIGKKVLEILINRLTQNDTMETVIIVKVVDAVAHLLKIEKTEESKVLLVDKLLHCRTLFTTKPVPSNLDSILKTVMLDKGSDQSLRTKIKALFDPKPETDHKKDVDTPKDKDPPKETKESTFPTPVTKSGKKITKKKEASIINTVVENGEEFAVIKSNWKFNTRKLTENQKEKLQRKREDIPALYQDLSQSQDEFKLKSWKTDSQDASTTNSRSASTPSSDNISTIQNMPGTDIVPKIIDNFFSETPKRDTVENTVNKEADSPKPNKTIQAKSSPSVKTPRMALKDRVFRNVRNLIEKSNVTKEGVHTPDLNQTVSENALNTPVSKCKDTDKVINSAPSQFPADRPTRVKRKPKKFDDTEIYLLKKRRNSSNQNESQSQSQSEINDTSEEPTKLPENDNVNNTLKTTTVTGNNTDDVNNTLKVATVSVENLEVLNSDVSKSKTSIVESGSIEKAKEVDSNEQNKLMVAEVSSSSVENITKNEDDNANANPELKSVVNCSEIDMSADKSIEETQRPQESKDTAAAVDDAATPNNNTKKKENAGKSTSKKKSRIEKELAIDTVEGHPFLKLQSDKRITRKCLASSPNSTRRKSLADKLNKSKTDSKTTPKSKKDMSSKNDPNEKSKKDNKDLSITVCETQEISPDATQDLSEDVIESSQDTTTTISVKSFRSCTSKQSSSSESIEKTVLETQNSMDISALEINSTADVTQDIKDDTELPANKTDVQNIVTLDLTEEMDTEPTSSGDVIIVNDDEPVIDLNTNDCDPGPGPDTLELANADTLPTDPSQFVNSTNVFISQNDDSKNCDKLESENRDSELTSTAEDRTVTLIDISQSSDNGASSPTKDDDQRKKDFLNNTSEISPIKSLSPIEPKSPSPETSNDFIVIKLSGPVQMNGDPLEMTNSPEIFTEERVSPDKRDQSPPRAEAVVANSSPSSSLSLKKNRPQVRSGGRAAQMLGLCVPDRLQTIMNVDRPEPEEPKKSSPMNTPARRNLRMLYQTAVDSDSSDGKDDSENFLKFKKTVPTADCSPSGPILKRKLADIADEATVSPANKRKRVSFHDPVSTSVSVQKYIETSGLRSPSNSALKRLERQLRHQSPMKSPKRLESLFKLDTVLTKAIESFSENDVTSSNDTELSSLEQTPAVEIVKTSELNDKDPIFPDLIDCKDSIDNIASELSSPAMRLLLVKELEGKIETVGDLAKLTELEVHRICIKAPKVQVAKKVLANYASKRDKIAEPEKVAGAVGDIRDSEPTVNMDTTESEATVNIEPIANEEPTVNLPTVNLQSTMDVEPTVVEPTIHVVPAIETSSVAVQTNNLTSETETQTSLVLQRLTSTQTETTMTLHQSSQTIESGNKSTEDIIKLCLKDRKDFVSKLNEQLEKASKLKLAASLPLKECTDLIVKKMTSSDTTNVLNSILQRGSELHSNGPNSNKELSLLQNYMCDKFEGKDLLLFCSQMLQKVHDKGF